MNTDVTALRLSRTARTSLEGAAAHPEHWVELPALPAAARNGVVRSMLRAGLVEEVASEGGNGAVPTLRATAVGLKAVRHDASHERAWPDIRPLQAQVDSDSGATIFATGEADLAQSQALVRWSPTVGQFDGLVKLGPGCCQAANLIMLPTP
jgi:hypothetical protein